ncbi:MAG: hypothetical protein WAT66_02610, partial [Actinomycetota bacterium]
SELTLSSSYGEESDADDVRDLDADQKEVLLDIAGCTDANWTLNRLYRDRSRANSLLVAVSRLELQGLVEREWHGAFHLTRKGRRVARSLDSTP